MSSVRKQAIVIMALIILIACAGWFARSFNSNFKDNNALSSNVVETNKTLNYFAESRMDRDGKYQISKAGLEGIVKNKSLTKKVRSLASVKLMKLNEREKSESSIESLIKGRGYDEALCTINDKNVEVCVRNSVELTAKQANEIKTIVMDNADRKAGDIYIKTKE